MQTGGEYIKDRLLPRLVQEACDHLGVQCQSFSDDWVLQIQRDVSPQYIVGYKFDLNQAATAALAADKVAAYLALQSAGVPAIEHCLYRGGDMPSMSNVHNGVVVKPLTGTGGRGVSYFASPYDAWDHMQKSSAEAWAVSPYVKITREIRTILLDGVPLLMYDKIPATQEGAMVLFNLGKGATAVDLDIRRYGEVSDLAIRAQQALGLRVAAVDCVELDDGSLRVLEVNDGIMMEYYARISPEHYKRAYTVYAQLVKAMIGTKENIPT